MCAAGLVPATYAGSEVKPHDWNALIEDPDTILIDTRNAYEVAIGTFQGAIDPETGSFGEFPAWFDSFAQKLGKEGKRPKDAMFCRSEERRVGKECVSTCR